MKLLQIYFRFNGRHYKGTALAVEGKKRVRYIVNIPGIKENLTVIADGSSETWLAWKDYDTNEESMLIEMIGKAIERAH